MSKYESAKERSFYFIGVTTGQSSIMRVFPKWAAALGIEAVIKGIDLPPHSPDADYREAAAFIRDDPLSAGALVTTHKIDLYRACRDMFDYVDPYADRLGEVSSLSKRGGQFRAHAKDPVSSGMSLAEFVPAGYWEERGGEALIIGAGGSALAMSLYLTRAEAGGDVPRRVTIANRSAPRLESAKAALDGAAPAGAIRYVHGPSPDDNDRLVAELPPHSLIVNATGLGKDAPGSPTTDGVVFPEDSLVWEINYRGDLVFMRQALAQAETRRLRVEDGWRYFIHGWTQVISEVFDVAIGRDVLARLSEIAK